jgi:uncharacterized protein
MRRLEERLRYLRELDERRSVIIDSISQQGKLDPALRAPRSHARLLVPIEGLWRVSSSRLN